MRLPAAATLLLVVLGTASCASTARRPADLTEVGVVDAIRLLRGGQVSSVELTIARVRSRPRDAPTRSSRPDACAVRCTGCRSS
jgi:hypothetical protein